MAAMCGRGAILDREPLPQCAGTNCSEGHVPYDSIVESFVLPLNISQIACPPRTLQISINNSKSKRSAEHRRYWFEIDHKESNCRICFSAESLLPTHLKLSRYLFHTLQKVDFKRSCQIVDPDVLLCIEERSHLVPLDYQISLRPV